MIKLTTTPSPLPLFGQSKWWGEPDLPEWVSYPELTVTDENGEAYLDPLTFICQIRCEDIAPLDPERLLPHEGMLYFFAALDYFLGDIYADSYPGMGLWGSDYYRVIYSPTVSDLHTHHIANADGTPATLPAESITFQPTSGAHEGDHHQLLGLPFFEEVREQMPGRLSLLQVDESDRWGLTFHDSGMLNFLISRDDLLARRWERAECYLFSF